MLKSVKAFSTDMNEMATRIATRMATLTAADSVMNSGETVEIVEKFVENLAKRLTSGRSQRPLALAFGASVLLLMGAVPAMAEPWFTYTNTPTTDSLATSAASHSADLPLARLEIDSSGWWTIVWDNGHRIRFQFTSPQQAQVQDDRLSSTAVTAQYEQEFIPSTGEVRYTLRHDRGEFSFQVVATDGPAVIDREVMLAEQKEAGVQVVGNLP